MIHNELNVQKKPKNRKAISLLVAYLKNNVLTDTGFTFSCDGSTFTFAGRFGEVSSPVFEELSRAASSTSFADDIFNAKGICGFESYLSRNFLESSL